MLRPLGSPRVLVLLVSVAWSSSISRASPVRTLPLRSMARHASSLHARATREGLPPAAPAAAPAANRKQDPPIPLEDLPETAGYLNCAGTHVYIQGTIHGSSTSATEVSALLKHPAVQDRVKYIVIELDDDRFSYLMSRRKGTRRDRKKTIWQAFERIMTDPKEDRRGQALLGLLLSAAMRAGEALEFEKGADFLAAIDAAEASKIPLVLADQPTNQTVDSMFRELRPQSLPKHIATLPRNLQFLLQTLPRAKNGRVSLKSALGRLPRAAQVFFAAFCALAVSSEIPFEWNVAARHAPALDFIAGLERYLLAYLALCLPRVLQALFAERDLRMLSAIETVSSKAAAGVPDEEEGTHESPVVVAIVGLAHVNSMMNVFQDSGLRQVARESRSSRAALDASAWDQHVVDWQRKQEVTFDGVDFTRVKKREVEPPHV